MPNFTDLSDCHNAPVGVAYDVSTKESVYSCSRCNNVCDLKQIGKATPATTDFDKKLSAILIDLDLYDAGGFKNSKAMRKISAGTPAHNEAKHSIKQLLLETLEHEKRKWENERNI